MPGYAVYPSIEGKIVFVGSQREADVLQLLAQGRSNKDIARRLAITEGTAKTHVKAILTKLDAMSRTEAVAIAHKRGLVHL